MNNKISEIRFAGKDKGEVIRQKEIWKLCFGDSDNFIDFFFKHKYKEDETVLLLHDGEVAARLTMLPMQIVAADRHILNTVMLYGIATHPNYQGRGFATRMMGYTHQYLKEKNNAFSVLVPAEKHLFDFYQKQGYQDGFYIREILLTRDKIEKLPVEEVNFTMKGTSPKGYNQIRNKLLSGKLYIAYRDEEISYQKRISQQSGTDIFLIEIENAQGCAAIERISPGKVFIKEILISDDVLRRALKQITKMLPADEYVIRMPAFLGEQLEGSTRSFGVFKKTQEVELKIQPGDLGYLGLAFD
ncbi:MAG: GNAT family N-acetyltransferase [Desulfitobacteriaceae bacterium]|nr:GNAT family N-acetyltransferase [Desulfitobacteriaceae bacterium]